MAKHKLKLSLPQIGGTSADDSTIKRIMRLIDNIRQYGHLKADIYPVNAPKRTHVPKLEIEDFNLDKETLENISSGIVSDHFSDIYDNAYEALKRMEKRYKGSIAFEYNHINNNKERTWLKRRIETPYKATINSDEKSTYLKHLLMLKVLKNIYIRTLSEQNVSQLKV